VSQGHTWLLASLSVCISCRNVHNTRDRVAVLLLFQGFALTVRFYGVLSWYLSCGPCWHKSCLSW
jgi:hypothetical protein